VIDGNLWAIVASTEPSLVLARFLENHADGFGAEDIEQYEEMRRQTMLTGSIILSAQTRAWLGALPRGAVNFRRLDFAIFDNELED
jgi:hypothetical protein